MFNNTDKRYNQFSAYLKNRFGAKVYKITLDAGFSCPNRDGKIGVGGTNHIGFIVSHEVSWSVTANPSINIPLGNTSIDKKSGQYEMKLNERISTSADPLDVGAMADVYVGYESGVDVGLIESLSIIDSTTYSYVTDAVAKGAVKVLASGKDARGQAFYIVIGDKVSFGKTLKRTFAYTQKHIIGTLIPDLKKKRDALLRNGTQEQIQALANETKTNQYMIDGDGYQCIFPTNNDNSGVDLVMQYNNAISNWEGVVARNEKAKLDAIKGNVLVSHYSVAGTAIDHSESVSQYYQDRSYKQDKRWYPLYKGQLPSYLNQEAYHRSSLHLNHKAEEYYASSQRHNA